MKRDNVIRLRRITVRVPKDLLEQVQAHAGEGVAETVRAALKCLVSLPAQHESKTVTKGVKPSLRVKQNRD
jgi:antitoxin component of MazEF toxin-antitoxin module